jgi:hypothetical protein
LAGPELRSADLCDRRVVIRVASQSSDALTCEWGRGTARHQSAARETQMVVREATRRSQKSIAKSTASGETGGRWPGAERSLSANAPVTYELPGVEDDER